MENFNGKVGSSLENRIRNIKDFFLGMKIEPYTDETNDYKTMVVSVRIQIPKSWEPFSELCAEKYKVGIQKTERVVKKDSIKIADEMVEAELFVDIEYGIDNIFSAIDIIIQKNKDREDRLKLYNQKAEELAKIYEEGMDKLTKLFEDDGRSLKELEGLSCNSFIKEETPRPAKSDERKPIIKDKKKGDKTEEKHNTEEVK